MTVMKKKKSIQDGSSFGWNDVLQIMENTGLKQAGSGYATFIDEHGTYFVTFVTVTQSAATTLISRFNDHNRFRSDDHVRKLAIQRIRNKWRINGSTLVFDRDGKVIDSSHRLMMVKSTGLETTWPAIFGVPITAFTTIDGHNKRKLVHAVQTVGKTDDNIRQKVASHLFRFERELCFERKHYTPAQEEGLDIIRKYDTRMSEAINYVSSVSRDAIFPKDVLAFAFTVFLGIDPVSARYYMYQVLGQSPVKLNDKDPVTHIRARGIKTLSDRAKMTRYNKLHTQLALLFNGWNFFCRGRLVDHVSLKEGKPNRFPDGAVRHAMPELKMPERKVSRQTAQWFDETPFVTKDGITTTGYEPIYVSICNDSSEKAVARQDDRRVKSKDESGVRAMRLGEQVSMETSLDDAPEKAEDHDALESEVA